jgi:type I restriction enzyme S subunit
MEDRLHELAKGWAWATVGGISRIIHYGYTASSSANQTGPKFLRITDIQNNSVDWDAVPYCKIDKSEKGKYLLKEGDLVFARTGATVGKSFLIRGNIPETIFASYLIRIILDDRIDPVFISNFFQSINYWRQIHKGKIGIGQPNVNAQILSRIAIPLPPLPEQHRIVAKIEELFTKLDAGIEALKKIKSQLKRYRQAVLKYAFEGKLTEEWRKNIGAYGNPPIEPASVLLERIKEERKKEAKGKYKELPPLDTSALPELPEGWVWTRIGDISGTIHYGYTASAEDKQVGPKLMRITDIQNNSVHWSSVPYCKIDDSEKGKYLLKDGDLVFARTGATVGKSFLIRGKIPETVFASYLIRIILDENIDRAYVYDFFQSNFYWSQIQKGKLGIGQPNVNAQVLSQLSIPLPSFQEQEKIVEEIESRLSIADGVEKVAEQTLRQSERLRQSILKQAFEGKLVPQDPTDEPAEKLLERIKTERAKRDAEEKGKKRVKRKNQNQLELI